jgi:hypothetical protein
MQIVHAIHPLLSLPVLFGSFVCGPAQEWIKTSAPQVHWITVACSADGATVVAAAAINGPIYTSPDAGLTWAPASPPATVWTSVASSADGTKLAALPGLEPNIYLTTNAGATWTSRAIPKAGESDLAMSADGTKLMIVGNGVTFSSDFGATWTNSPVAPGNSVIWIACSADGTKLVVEAQGPYSPVYVSTNSGASWFATSGTNDYPGGVAISADGATMVAASYTFDLGGPIYVSANGGATWLTATVPNDYWTSVTCSADGTRMAAKGSSGVYLSTDSGATWNLSGGRTGWVSQLASSADGCWLVMESQVMGIYTYRTTPAPILALRRSSENLVLSWIVPSMAFSLQRNDDLNTTNWTDVDTPPILNCSTLRHEVAFPVPSAARFYRLKAQ